jgi:hypothetical protein
LLKINRNYCLINKRAKALFVLEPQNFSIIDEDAVKKWEIWRLFIKED